jgi:hypothetical protein
MTRSAMNARAAKQFAEKVGFLRGRTFSSDNKWLAFSGLQPLRKRFEAFFRKLKNRSNLARGSLRGECGNLDRAKTQNEHRMRRDAAPAG